MRIDWNFEILALASPTKRLDKIPPHAPRPRFLVLVLLQACSYTPVTMPGPKNTVLIEGSFEELTDEFAQYIDGLKKSQGDEGSKSAKRMRRSTEREQER